MIAPEKITRYLLNLDHPEGRAKAKALYAMGFTVEQPELLENALRDHGFNCLPALTIVEDGTKYICEGDMNGPNQTVRSMRTVWKITKGEDYPRFVTLVPNW